MMCGDSSGAPCRIFTRRRGCASRIVPRWRAPATRALVVVILLEVEREHSPAAGLAHYGTLNVDEALGLSSTARPRYDFMALRIERMRARILLSQEHLGIDEVQSGRASRKALDLSQYSGSLVYWSQATTATCAIRSCLGQHTSATATLAGFVPSHGVVLLVESWANLRASRSWSQCSSPSGNLAA